MTPIRDVLLSTALFPPLEYMTLLLFYPKVCIEAQENYSKQTYRNRFYILGPNGKQMLHVPVEKKGMQHCPIQEVTISHPKGWKHIHLRSLQTAYSSAPWFIHYYDDLCQFYDHLPANLWEMNLQSIHLSARMLGTILNPDFSASYRTPDESFYDYREKIHPKRTNPFPTVPETPLLYQQVFIDRYGFIPGLSILDLIFNEGPLALSWLKNYYHTTIAGLFTEAETHIDHCEKKPDKQME